jgi:cytochrome b561
MIPWLVIAQFGLAETWSDAAPSAAHVMVLAHMSFGVLLTAVLVSRIAWRLSPGHGVAPAVSGLEALASKTVHALLYLMLVAQALLGFALRWGAGRAMPFFGLQLPSVIPRVAAPGRQLIAAAHHWNGWAIIMLAGGHAVVALGHHFVVRDRVLTRMLPLANPLPRRRRSAVAARRAERRSVPRVRGS